MNWTGGSLQRHSKNAHKSVMNRQREHFAKVRTALQNGSATPSVPFRPSYVQAEDVSLGGRLRPFGSGSVRHTGHSQRLQRQRRRESSTSQRSEHRDSRNERERLAEPATSRGGPAFSTEPLPSEYALASPMRSAQDESKDAARISRKPSGGSAENQLLEANRRRLLEQEDWVGLTPSRPVRMHFPSIREKARIGKRRKIGRRPGQQTSREKSIVRQPLNATHHEHLRRYPSGAIRKDVDDIRIRIGTDALASQTPMEQTDNARPQRDETYQEGSPDPMLFDQEDLYSAPEEPNPVPQSFSSNWTVLAGSVTEQQDQSQQDRSQQHPRPSERAHLRETLKHQNATQHGQNEAIGSTFQVFGGPRRQPLCLIFGQSSDSPADNGVADDAATMLDDDNVADVPGQANAGFPDFGHARSREGNEGANTGLLSIVNDRRWKAFVGVPEANSTRSTVTLSHTPQQPGKRGGREGRGAAWSQHATVGDPTCIGVSSPISASLSCINRSDDRGRLGHASDAEGSSGHGTSWRQSHGIDESERLWRTFVLGDIDELDSSSMAAHENSTGARRGFAMSRVSGIDECEAVRSRVPIVSSPSSRLFPSISRLAPRQARG